MNGGLKEVLKLEEGALALVNAATINSQACDLQFMERLGQSIAARLLKVCGIGLVAWLLFGVFTHPGFNIAREVPAYYEFWTDFNEPGYSGPSDGAVLSESLFTLPVDSDVLYLISRGAFQYGTVTVEQSIEASDSVIVRVRAAYHMEEAFERAYVCHLKRQANETGIAIYTPKSRLPRQDNKDQLMLDVTLTLPASAGEDVLDIKSLATSAPLFRHEVAALSDTVFFISISLNTLHLPINVQSVAAETEIFTTANGHIEGHFHSTSSLKLVTTNMAIDADVNLFHDEVAKPLELVTTTANAPLDARVSLTTASGYAGEFKVDA
ncbi:hypothetical protein DEU56DRAFT_907665 [Suillus clintonianus]|uniref:uncharacterized protein n=1 Tax=Suillus clintonianus TaxID=1904413 RepID=UPI001B85BC8E|nr:uncharacterized protein DEU56DRAFT_907665 [Suillus clintonianus]KAG2153225.1 hypothetical protein DEU56DRAFT_907665 [Suillus clintonianus]